MEEINKQPVYEKPKLEIIRIAETDVIATSGESDNPIEGEIIQTLNYYNFGGTNQ